MAFGERINNPLNIRDFGRKWVGYAGPYRTSGNGVFARFDSPENGYRAAFKNMAWIARKKGAKTIADMINVWAPPADNNNTSAYVQRVAQMSGIPPTAAIPFNDRKSMVKLAKAMTAVELGRVPYKDDVVAAGYNRAFNKADNVTEPARSPWSQGLREATPLPGETDPRLPTTSIPPHVASNPRPVQQVAMNTPMNASVNTPDTPDFMSRLGSYWTNKMEPRLQGKDGMPPLSAILMTLGAGMLRRKPGAGLTQLFAQWPQMEMANQLRQLQIGQATSKAEQQKRLQASLLNDPDPQIQGLAKAGMISQAAQMKAYKMRVPYELAKARAMQADKPLTGLAKSEAEYKKAVELFGKDSPQAQRAYRAMQTHGLDGKQKEALQAVSTARDAIRSLDASIAKSGRLTPSGPGEYRRREQLFTTIQKSVAQATNMGANWTEQEIAVTKAIIGGDPTSFWTWLTDNPTEYRKRLRVIDGMLRKTRTLIMRGPGESAPLPPVEKTPAKTALPPGVKYKGTR